jgi:hypothetical protein
MYYIIYNIFIKISFKFGNSRFFKNAYDKQVCCKNGISKFPHLNAIFIRDIYT